jgi:hypothetical protein
MNYKPYSFIMKNTMYKLLFVLCLFVGASCSPDNQEGNTTGTTESAADTTATNEEVSNEVPKGLEAH